MLKHLRKNKFCQTSLDGSNYKAIHFYARLNFQWPCPRFKPTEVQDSESFWANSFSWNIWDGWNSQLFSVTWSFLRRQSHSFVFVEKIWKFGLRVVYEVISFRCGLMIELPWYQFQFPWPLFKISSQTFCNGWSCRMTEDWVQSFSRHVPS